jgi:hypothetical protein
MIGAQAVGIEMSRLTFESFEGSMIAAKWLGGNWNQSQHGVDKQAASCLVRFAVAVETRVAKSGISGKVR